MPNLDFAFLCDHARGEEGIFHAIAGAIDTVYAPQVPSGRNVGLVARFTFTRNECGRPHRIEIIVQDTDGKQITKIGGTLEPALVKDQPIGWDTGVLFAVNFGLPLPAYGVYSIEILLNDSSVKSINLRVVQPPAEG